MSSCPFLRVHGWHIYLLFVNKVVIVIQYNLATGNNYICLHYQYLVHHIASNKKIALASYVKCNTKKFLNTMHSEDPNLTQEGEVQLITTLVLANM